MINNLKFIHFFTTALIVELFMLYLFRFTKSPFTGESINNWYTNFKWSAIILDVASVIIGFYLARYLYNYLISINFIDKKNVLVKYLLVLLFVQILHDFGFYFTILKNATKGKNSILDELVSYAKKVKTGAVIGDSFMYLLGTPILFFLVSKLNNETNSFISVVSIYLIGYFIYQKPLN